MNRSRDLVEARIRMTRAINHSQNGEVLCTIDELTEAVERLRDGGLVEMASVIEDIRDGDCLCAESRHDLRQLAQFVDSYLEVDESIDPAVAFDGGGRK